MITLFEDFWRREPWGQLRNTPLGASPKSIRKISYRSLVEVVLLTPLPLSLAMFSPHLLAKGRLNCMRYIV